MITLRKYIRNLILEMAGDISPGRKVIFMAGAPGAGKSTVLKQLGLINQFEIVNPDDWYEPFLEEAGISLDIHTFTQKYFDIMSAIKAGKAEGLDVTELQSEREALRPTMSENMKLFARARKLAKEKASELSSQGIDFIIDGTGGNYKEISKLNTVYKHMGYDTGMIYISVPKTTSIERNWQRGEKGKRRIHSDAAARSWDSVDKNLEPYKLLFGNSFFFVDNSSSFEDFQENIESIRSNMETFLL
tara:strand:- start:50395 stop:51132 length:738 start_codon:yes stop_codon:yes gene_type:complete